MATTAPTEVDAFGELQQPRTVLPPREQPPPAATPQSQAAPIKPQMRLVPERHRDSFAHSSTWWQGNIEIYKHHETGRYLYLSREGEGENEKIKGYMYQGATHKFVEISVDTAISLAAVSEKKGQRNTGRGS